VSFLVVCGAVIPYEVKGIAMAQWLWIGFAGGLGALARYGMTGLVQRLLGTGFPYGTFVVNMLGSFLFGLIWSLAEGRLVLTPQTRTILLTGFMGAFTTFSTFMYETGGLMQDSQWTLAFGNVALQIIVGLICLFAGLALGQLL
jgi:CrcB protein